MTVGSSLSSVALAIPMDREVPTTQKSKTIQLRDFFWDRVINTTIVLVFGVISIQTIASYFEGGGLKCVIAENHSISVLEYINQLCLKDVPIYGKFYNIFLYVETVLLSGLQVFWSQIWSGHIQMFESTVASMSLIRNKTTGQFEADDFDLARDVEQNLESTTLTRTYMLKVFLQMIVCLIGIGILTFGLGFSNDIDTMLVFECYNDTLLNGQWPLVEQSVHCVLTELSNLQILQWLNFIALFVIMYSNIASTFQLAYSLYYFQLLDYKRVAKFIFYTGLKREHYPNKYYSMTLSRCYIQCRKCCNNGDDERALIPFDMIFLIVKLHRTDSKIVRMLLNVLIDNHLDYLVKNECSKLARSLMEKSLGSKMEGIITSIQLKQPTNTDKPYCILVTTDNDSLAYLLENCGLFKKLICINFNSVITATRKLEFCHSNPLVYHIPSKIWSVNENILAEKTLEEQIKDIVKDLYAGDIQPSTIIVLAPLSDEVYRYKHGELLNIKQRVISLFQQIKSVDEVTTCGRANRLHFVGIVPEKIANRDVSNEFCGGAEVNSQAVAGGFDWLLTDDSTPDRNRYSWNKETVPEERYKFKVEGVTVSYKLVRYVAEVSTA